MRWISRLAGAAGAVLVGWLGAGGAAAAPALWRVSDHDSQIYLFGTLHVLSPKAQWRTPLYDRVLREAHTVWLEADVRQGDAETLRLLFQRYGSDPDVPLSRKLPPVDLAALARQTDVAKIQHLRPWAAALMLSMQPALARGATADRGVEGALTRGPGGKRLATFETLEDQARMFASLPPPAEVRYLTTVIRDRDRGRSRLRLPFQPASLEAAWLAGRLGDREIAQMRTSNPALYDALLRRRNIAWTDRLAGEMAGQGTELVNVGALHMLGPDGLPALLAARGFRVERVQ